MIAGLVFCTRFVASSCRSSVPVFNHRPALLYCTPFRSLGVCSCLAKVWKVSWISGLQHIYLYTYESVYIYNTHNMDLLKKRYTPNVDNKNGGRTTNDHQNWGYPIFRPSVYGTAMWWRNFHQPRPDISTAKLGEPKEKTEVPSTVMALYQL